MSDLSTPTLVIVTDVRGGNSIHIDVLSIVADESKGDLSQLSITTLTPPPAWYTSLDFPVNSITVAVQGGRIFTGYVTVWRQSKPSGTWVIEAVDVLYVAENEWLVPETMTEMLTFSGQATDFVRGLLADTCGYAVVSIGAIPFTLGPDEPFEYGFESVKDLIDRLNAILQTQLWADKDGGVHWDWAADYPDDDFGLTCPTVEGTTQGGVYFRGRNRGSVWVLIGQRCAAYQIAMNSAYATYNTSGMMLAEHRQHKLAGEAATRPTRGNLLNWDQTEDEDTYRVGAIVFGLPPIKKEYDKGDFPYAPLADLNNVAIVSSAIIQEEWMAADIARLLAEQSIVKRTAQWEAIGHNDFHVNVTHFFDTDGYFGFGKVISVTHTVDDTGYTMRGESNINYCAVRAGVSQGVVQFQDHILSADVSGGVERYEGTFTIDVVYNEATGLWEDSSGVNYSYKWEDISLPAWTADMHEVAFVHAPGAFHAKSADRAAGLEGFALAINEQGIWRNGYVSDWTRTPAEIGDEWELIMTPAEWAAAASAGYDAGLITCIQADGAKSRWPDRAFNPSTTHFMMQEPTFMLETGIIRFGVMASGAYYYAGLIGGWISASHIFLFRATLSSLGELSNLQSIGALHDTGGLGGYYPWDGWWNWSGWSYTDRFGKSLIWARPLNYPWGAGCYSMDADTVAVDAALPSHGGSWFDSSQRFNHMVEGPFGLCSTAGNSVRGYVARRCISGGGSSTISIPNIGGGGIADWRGVALWGGLKNADVLALMGTPQDTEFSKFVAKWGGADGAGIPQFITWIVPFVFMVWLITTDGKVHRMDRMWDHPRAPGDITTPEEELWDDIFENIAAETMLDGTWNQTMDLGGGVHSQDCPYLVNPYTGTFFAAGNRIYPASMTGGTPYATGKQGSSYYNFAPCGGPIRKVILLNEDGSELCDLEDCPPCCKKAADPQCCGTTPLRADDGSAITGLAGTTTVRF